MRETRDNITALLTMAEVAALLRCSKAHVSNIVSGKVNGVPALPSVQLGRRILVRREAMLTWLRSLEATE